MKMEGCANFIAFGGDGSLFKKNCNGDDTYTYKYCETTDKWDQLGQKHAYAITADSKGTPWIIDNYQTQSVWKWQSNNWLNMGLSEVESIVAGTEDQIYALAKPFRGKE